MIRRSDLLRSRIANAMNEAGISPGMQQQAALSSEDRYAAVLQAKRLRNFWFTSNIIQGGAPITTNTRLLDAGNFVVSETITARYGVPIIVTDILSLFELYWQQDATGGQPLIFTKLQRIGGEDNATSVNLFNSTVPLISYLTIKHERNRKVILQDLGDTRDINELGDKDFPIVPFLLRPYEALHSVHYIPTTYYLQVDEVTLKAPHLGVRGFQVLAPDSPYASLSALAETQVRNYIKTAEPETFLMRVTFPFSDISAGFGLFKDVRTPQQDRPLLILGCASNLSAASARLEEDSGSRFRFTSANDLPNEIPLSLFAGNTDFRNENLFCKWPVPHFLEPGAMLRMRVINGAFPTYPNANGTPFAPGAGSVLATTRNDQNVEITFLCRTP